MLIKVFDHHPAAVLDYYIDWGPWLAGDSIETSTWVPTGGTITLSEDAVLGDFTQVWASDWGTGALIDMDNYIVTTEGREEVGTIRLRIRG